MTSHKRRKTKSKTFLGAVSSKSRCVIALSFRMRERTLRKGSVGMITCLDDNRKNKILKTPNCDILFFFLSSLNKDPTSFCGISGEFAYQRKVN